MIMRTTTATPVQSKARFTHNRDLVGKARTLSLEHEGVREREIRHLFCLLSATWAAIMLATHGSFS
ncbi:hypothetical protein ACHAXH_002264 [Discostella pseudostelligera]